MTGSDVSVGYCRWVAAVRRSTVLLGLVGRKDRSCPGSIWILRMETTRGVRNFIFDCGSIVIIYSTSDEIFKTHREETIDLTSTQTKSTTITKTEM